VTRDLDPEGIGMEDHDALGTDANCRRSSVVIFTVVLVVIFLVHPLLDPTPNWRRERRQGLIQHLVMDEDGRGGPGW